MTDSGERAVPGRRSVWSPGRRERNDVSDDDYPRSRAAAKGEFGAANAESAPGIVPNAPSVALPIELQGCLRLPGGTRTRNSGEDGI